MVSSERRTRERHAQRGDTERVIASDASVSLCSLHINNTNTNTNTTSTNMGRKESSKSSKSSKSSSSSSSSVVPPVTTSTSGGGVFREYDVRLWLQVPPRYIGSIDRGVHAQLSYHLLKYHKELDGVVVSFRGIKVEQCSARILYEAPHEAPYCHVSVLAKFLTFAPRKGQRMRTYSSSSYSSSSSHPNNVVDHDAMVALCDDGGGGSSGGGG